MSNALRIARRLKLPRDLLRRAHRYLLRLRPNDPVRVPKFDRPGRVVRVDHKRNVAVVSLGLGQWEVPLDEVFPQDKSDRSYHGERAGDRGQPRRGDS